MAPKSPEQSNSDNVLDAENPPTNDGDTENLAASETSPVIEAEKNPFDSRRTIVSYFLTDYKNKNKDRLSDEQIDQIDKAIELINAENKKDHGLEVAGKIIKARAEKFQSQKKDGMTEGDYEIFDYMGRTITNALQNPENSDNKLTRDETGLFKRFLDTIKVKGTEKEKVGAEKLMEQLEEANKPKKRVRSAKQAAAVMPEGQKNVSEVITADTEAKKKPEGYEDMFSVETAVAESLSEKESKAELQRQLNELMQEREKVVFALGGELPEVEKAKLLEQKRLYSDQIIRMAGDLLGRDVRKEIKEEMESNWQKSIRLRGFKDENEYNQKAKKDYGDDLIKKSNLSEEQRQDLLEGKDIRIGGRSFFGDLTITREQALAALAAGEDLTKIKTKFFSKKVVLNGRLVTDKEFEDHFSIGKEKYEKNAQVQVEKNKADIFEKNSQVLDAITENRIRNVVDRINDLKSNPPPLPEKKNKVEPPPLMQESEREELTEDLVRKWRQAKLRDKKIKEIEKALAAGKFKTKGEDGLSDKEAEEKIRAFKKELEDKNAELSDEIISKAGKLSYRNLKKEAVKETGYKLDKDQEKQKEYRKWLTKEVEKIMGDKVKKPPKLPDNK